MGKLLRFLPVVVILGLPIAASAQGLLVDTRPDHQFRLPRPHIWPPRPIPRPEPPQSYKIERLEVRGDITNQVAKIQVTQSFVNTGSRQMEVSFIFPLPYDSAVDSMTFMVDGKEYDAKLLTAAEARQIYEQHVRRNQDPALLEWIGTGMFKTSVFPVPPGARRTVTLKYSQLCRKFDGLTEWLFPLSTAKYTSGPIDKISVDVTIRSQAPIKNVYSPTHLINTQRPSEKLARISWEAERGIPAEDFRLLYDVGRQAVAASVVSYRPSDSDEGYFLLLLSPEIKSASRTPTRKTVVFVVDRSGSMSGKKIEQAKGALKFVLNNLNEGDLFNIVAYDNTVESFQPELQRYDNASRAAALDFVEGLYAGGSTNIDGALETALAQLRDDQRPSYVVFLTDGLPTAGEKNEPKIVANARQRNKVRARLFAFGVGFDVNSRLLDKLARDCFGQSQYVRPNEDLETHVSQLYARISAPVLVDMRIKYQMKDAERSGSPVNRIYPRDTQDLFAGTQLVLVGRYKQTGPVTITVTGTVDDTAQEFAFDGHFVARSPDDSTAYVEKLWAIRRVGEIIDEIDLHGTNQELIDELTSLATRHGILTPYTSFLADETANVRDVVESRRRAGVALDALSAESGESAFFQRLAKGNLQRANMPSSSFGMSGAAPGMDAAGSGMAGGMGGGLGSMPGGPPAGSPAREAARGLGAFRPSGGQAGRADQPAEPAQPTVLQLGAKTFFWRNDRWEDSALTEELLKNLQRVEQYSDAYFQLATQLGKAGAKYLALDQPVVVVLDKTAYSIEAPK